MRVIGGYRRKKGIYKCLVEVIAFFLVLLIYVALSSCQQMSDFHLWSETVKIARTSAVSLQCHAHCSVQTNPNAAVSAVCMQFLYRSLLRLAGYPLVSSAGVRMRSGGGGKRGG